MKEFHGRGSSVYKEKQLTNDDELRRLQYAFGLDKKKKLPFSSHVDVLQSSVLQVVT